MKTPFERWFSMLICKYIKKKHEYTFTGAYWEGQKPWKTKVHVMTCKRCGHYKKTAV